MKENSCRNLTTHTGIRGDYKHWIQDLRTQTLVLHCSRYMYSGATALRAICYKPKFTIVLYVVTTLKMLFIADHYSLTYLILRVRSPLSILQSLTCTHKAREPVFVLTSQNDQYVHDLSPWDLMLVACGTR